MQEFERSELLLGECGMERLSKARVAVFGIGGVGGHACEALARCGVGELHLFDNDRVSVSNINRQIVALHSTVGRYKTHVMKERIEDINPLARVVTYEAFYLPENADEYDLSQYDFVIDAIDTVSAKLELAVRCSNLSVPIVSCMGTGNKLRPDMLEIEDIYKTSVCPLARVMRRELKARGIKKLPVLYSKEEPIKAVVRESGSPRHAPGSVSFVPSVAGLIIASYVVRRLTE